VLVLPAPLRLAVDTSPLDGFRALVCFLSWFTNRPAPAAPREPPRTARAPRPVGVNAGVEDEPRRSRRAQLEIVTHASLTSRLLFGFAQGKKPRPIRNRDAGNRAGAGLPRLRMQACDCPDLKSMARE
jgi:hypothetical protein